MNGEQVILLHGLGRTRRSMRSMQRFLERAGYSALNVGYPSTSATVETLTERYLAPAVERCLEHSGRLHLVTHSMGGILARHYMQQRQLPEGSRIVMLAPPNRGSEIVDRWRHNPLFRRATGPAGQQLGTEQESLPNALNPPQSETGIIIGNRPSDPWFAHLFGGPNDGKVSVDRARLEGQHDFLVIRAGHTFIPANPEAKRQTLHFLREGRFDISAATM